MKKKGFTLIELMGVIALLALIALIIFPSILNQMKKIDTNISEANKKLIYSAVDDYIDNDKTAKVCLNGRKELYVKLSVLKDAGVLSKDIDLKEYETLLVYYQGNKYQYEFLNTKIAENTICKDTSMEVKIHKYLIPVVISDDGSAITINKDDENWYNYKEKKWANAVLVKQESYDKYVDTSGVEVTVSDIVSYYVWIPRYEYKLFNSSTPIEIKINFISNRTKHATNGYIIHPAFWWDDNNNGVEEDGEQLSGIWVPKFETSFETVSYQSEIYRAIPGGRLIERTVKQAYDDSLNIKTKFWGGNDDSVDTHMMKNSEWAAVAYLSHSKYGTCTGGVCKEVESAPCCNLNTITLKEEECQNCCKKQGITDCENACEECCISIDIMRTAGGNFIEWTNSSTNHNISGIYDMASGAREYVMGNLNGYPTGKCIITGSTNCASGFGASSMPEKKYYNDYVYGDLRNELLESGNKISTNGHALLETKNWYNDISEGLTDIDPWMLRGGHYTLIALDDTKDLYGIFAYYASHGNTLNEVTSYRTIIIIK